MEEQIKGAYAMKILIIKSSLGAGGVDNLLINQILYLKNNGHEIWIQYCEGAKEFYREFYDNCNCKLIKMPKFRKLNLFLKEEIKFLKSNHFDIIHSHICHFSFLVLYALKKAKIQQKIFIHSHYDDYYKGWPYFIFIKPFLTYFINKNKSILIASSKKSGKALFGNQKFNLVYNGIDTNKFKFDCKQRTIVRNEFGINDDTKLVCNIGMFRKQKNHVFLIEIFEEFLKIFPNSLLVLIGDGPLRNKIEILCEKKHLKNKLIFLGIRNDVDKLLNAMDICFFPTKYEGFSMNLIELQCNGMPTICSSNAPKEVKQIEIFEFCSIKKPAKEWAEKGAQLLNNYRRKDYSEKIFMNKLDKKFFCQKIEALYYDEYKKNG